MNNSARDNSCHTFTVLGLAILLLIPGSWFQARPTNSAVEPQGIVYVSGEVPAGTTWTSNNVYVVTGDISMFGLTIQPGTTIKFDPETYMWVRGPLHAVGTPTNRITFTSNVVNPAPGDWGHNFEGGIFFHNCDDSSIIEYAIVEYSTGISVYKCAPVIRHNVIRFNEVISFNSAITIGSDQVPVPFPYPIIEGNLITHNTAGGGYSSNGGGAISVMGGATIRENRIIHNDGGAAGGIYMQSYRPSQDAFLIEDNLVWNNKGGVAGGVYVRGEPGSVVVQHNSIANNIAAASFGGACAGGLVADASSNVSYNSVVNNTALGVGASDNGGIIGGSTSLLTARLNYNNVVNSDDSYFAGVIASRDIDITNNFWGTTDDAEIAARILDSNDNWGLGTAHYQPYALTPIAEAPAFLWDLSLEFSIAGNSRVVTFDLSFSRAMEQTIHPVVTFGRIFPFSSYPVNTDAQWIDNSHWRATFDTSLVPCGSYTISVSGANGSDGLEVPPNTQHYLRIDTNCKAYVPIVSRH